MVDDGEHAALAARLRAEGLGCLTVDDLVDADLDDLAWSGSAAHLRSVAAQLSRMAVGQVEYLVVRTPEGRPIAKAGIDYAVMVSTGIIWQVVTHDELQGLGIGTFLLAVAEDRIVGRGCTTAALSVEVDNPRAQALYQRLGYRTAGRRQTGWEVDGPDGSTQWYSTEVTDMTKLLGPA